MNKTRAPHPDVFSLSDLESKLEGGDLLIPRFQREYVWGVKEVAKLLDSILKNFPVGIMTIWQTKDRLCTVKEICGNPVPQAQLGYPACYVLDGQQRLTSIYVALKGFNLPGKADYGAIYLLLDGPNEDDELVTVDVDKCPANKKISIKDLYSTPITSLTMYSDDDKIKIENYRIQLRNYPIPMITLYDAELAVATEIFTRINTNGKRLTLFEIVSARVYSDSFDLVQKREAQSKSWEVIGFDKLPDQTVLQAMALCLYGSCKRDSILRLSNSDMQTSWSVVDNAFGLAIDYLRSSFHLPGSMFLPYDSMILPFVYYFYRHATPHPEPDHAERLQDYFWRTALTLRYTEGMVSKVIQDIENVTAMLKGQPDKHMLPSIDISYQFILNNGGYSTTAAFPKAILCLLAMQLPKSFDNGGLVRLANDWLAKENAKNNHHFFPKAYMKKHPVVGMSEKMINHVVNITLVDSYINSTIIKDRAPSEYIKDFKANSDLAGTLESHLIGDLSDFGITDDCYEKFFKSRMKRIQDEIAKRIIKRPDDVLK